MSCKRILVSGPSVTELEVSYVTDAARNGWNEHCFDYINRFEEYVKKYLGVSYVLSTSSCTGALHLAFMALGLEPGDEVIVPESTWIATINAIHYTGAVPIFVDVDPLSWTIDPDKIEEAITSKTKVICPVHLYGHTANMKRILEIAKKHGIYVVEDAAQSMGGEQNSKKSGTFGDAGCFSFHGSKSIVMGEGGVLATNNRALYEKAKYLGDQSKHPTIRFFNADFGYKYKLSNLQAAFGLGQMERVDEIIAYKRQIFSWYRDGLKNIPDIQLNAELFGTKNTYWMVTIVLGDSYNMSGSDLSSALSKMNIDTRPFFYPLSTFPMLKQYKRFETPVAHWLSQKAINLPSGATLTYEEVKYVCKRLAYILELEGCKGENL